MRLYVCRFALFLQSKSLYQLKYVEDLKLLYIHNSSSFDYVKNKEVISAMTGKNTVIFTPKI
jgi:hypothetical protein